jgi:hypothetical protein
MRAGLEDLLACREAETQGYLRAIIPLAHSGGDVFGSAIRKLHTRFAVVHEPTVLAFIADKATEALGRTGFPPP